MWTIVNSSVRADLQQRLLERTKRRGGWRQFRESKCACIQERKPSECDCQDCTYVIENLALVHKQRANWHAALLRQAGGKPCDCHLHGLARQEAAVERRHVRRRPLPGRLRRFSSRGLPTARVQRKPLWWRVRMLWRLRRSSQLHSSASSATTASHAAPTPCRRR